MPFRYDATLKDLAQNAAEFAAAFGLPTYGPARSLNVDLSAISAATDAVIGFGDPIREIADINFQSGPDSRLPGRILLYNALLHLRFDVPVRSVVILLRPKADATALTGKLSYGDVAHRLEFGYEVVRLWQEPADRILQGGLSSLPLATLCLMPPDKPLTSSLRETADRIRRRLHLETNEAEADRLMQATYLLTGLRVDRSELSKIFEGVEMKEKLAAYDEAIEEGRIKAIRRQGRKMFGEPDAAVDAELKAMIDEPDPDRIDRLLDAVLTAKSWQELLATP